MDVFLFSFNAMAPVLISAGLGLFLMKRGLFSESFLTTLNALCFKVFLPLMLVSNLINVDFRAEFQPRLMGYAAVMIVAVAVILCLILPRFIKDRGKLGATLNAVVRSNYIIYSVPIVASMFGEEGRAVATMLVPVTVILFNLTAVIIVCRYSGEPVTGVRFLVKAVRDVARHPLILGCVAGAVLSLLPVELPVFLKATLSSLGGVGSPLSLVLVGAQLDLDTLRGSLRQIAAACGIRLLAVPLVCTSVAVLLGFRGAALASLFLISGAPCPVASMVMSRSANLAPKYAAQLVIATTLLASFTIFGGILLLRGLALI